MRVLVLKEKHGEDYFAVPVDKEGVVMLHVIKRRFESGWYDAVEDKEEWELLQKCVKGDDFTAAIKFFKLRQNGEYEDWDLINAHILPGAQYAYSPLPKECRARFGEISVRAQKLHEDFVNGNRSDVLKDLAGMEPRAALAVVAEMMLDYGHDARRSLHRWLKEVA